jgi:hypothetical protein
LAPLEDLIPLPPSPERRRGESIILDSWIMDHDYESA